MSFIKYPKVFHLGTKKAEGFISEEAKDNEIVVEEKMDGANFRFGYVDGKFRFGSRRVELTDAENYGMFEEAVDLAKRYEDVVKPGYIYFVEYMVPHTLQYDWERVPRFLGFDIYDTEAKKFLGYEEKQAEFDRIGIKMVPLVWMGRLEEFTWEEYEKLIPKSAYRDGTAEGLVIKDYERQFFVKVVAPEFREANLEVFGVGSRKRAKKYAKTGAEWFVHAFVGSRRIEKMIDRMREEGWELEMDMMKELPHRVMEDAWEEHYKDVIYENVEINMKEMRKLVAKRCVDVLRRVLVRESLKKNEKEVRE